MKPSDWNEVLRQLTGKRLAVYDDALRGRRIASQPSVQDTVGWLVFHRFVWIADNGVLEARSPIAARDLFLRDGPAKQAASALLTSLPGRVDNAEVPKADVLGGGFDDNADARPDPFNPPARRAVHASELLALDL